MNWIIFLKTISSWHFWPFHIIKSNHLGCFEFMMYECFNFRNCLFWDAYANIFEGPVWFVSRNGWHVWSLGRISQKSRIYQKIFGAFEIWVWRLIWTQYENGSSRFISATEKSSTTNWGLNIQKSRMMLDIKYSILSYQTYSDTDTYLQ